MTSFTRGRASRRVKEGATEGEKVVLKVVRSAGLEGTTSRAVISGLVGGENGGLTRGIVKTRMYNLVNKGLIKPVRYVEMEDTGQRAGIYVETDKGKAEVL